MWVIKGIAIVLLVLVGLVVLPLTALWLEHFISTELPKPTGQFKVGRLLDVWSDAQIDGMTPVRDVRRELLVWIWYPSQAAPAAAAEYLPPAWRMALERQRGPVISNILSRDLGRVRTHSLQDAPVVAHAGGYPVVLLRAGLAALTSEYTTLAEELASHGYVVVGFDAPYRSQVVVFPDGRVIQRAAQNDAELVVGEAQDQLVQRLIDAWTSDLSFAIGTLARINEGTAATQSSSRLSGQLDLQRIGIVGHSLGGAVALQFCQRDSRCKAAIDIDGAPYGDVIEHGVQQPLMFLLSDHANESGTQRRGIEANIRAIYERLPPERRLQVVVRDANHFNFSDGAVVKSQLLLGALHAVGVMPLSARRQLAITAHCVRRFLDHHLQGRRWSPLEDQEQYPEIQEVKP